MSGYVVMVGTGFPVMDDLGDTMAVMMWPTRAAAEMHIETLPAKVKRKAYVLPVVVAPPMFPSRGPDWTPGERARETATQRTCSIVTVDLVIEVLHDDGERTTYSPSEFAARFAPLGYEP